MPKVQAYVYDITQGMASRMSRMLLGKQIDIIPHTGIVAFGKEYYFGSGPCAGEPGKTVPVPVSQVLDLGETELTCEELERYIEGVLAFQHTADNYNLLHNNCNHFADAVAKFLLDGRGLPDSIVNIAQEALSTPQGQSLRVMIESMERSMRANSGGSASLNPFGGSGATLAVDAAGRSADGSRANEELEAAISEISGNEVEVRREALQTLLKITENIANNPKETKFRRIKMANPVFTKKVATCVGGTEAMVAVGWLPDTNDEGEDVWVLGEAAVGQQTVFRQRFAAELSKLPAPVRPAAPSAPTAPAGGLTGGPLAGLPGGFPAGLPGGLPGGLNPAMLQQAQSMMSNPQMAAQVQNMMQDPQMMAQVQQMMQNPQMMAQMQGLLGGMGGFSP